MARMPGGPRGGYVAVESKKFTCGCYPGQRVTIPRGLPSRCEPTRVTVVDEYESLVVFRLEFDQPDTWNGEAHTIAWNYSISKASLLCGDAVVKDLSGRTIRPKEEAREKKPRQRDMRDGGMDRGRRRPGDRLGVRSQDVDSLI